MVSSARTASQLTIIARPNLSATWDANVYAIFAIAIPSLGAAIGFAFFGAWPILPFVGLELGALALAFYVVQRKLQYRHVITVGVDNLDVQKGFRSAEKTWHLARARAGITVIPKSHPWDGPALAVHDDHERVVLGEFLNREDSLKLLALLRQELRVRSDSASIDKQF
ncbi:MAG: DUF2244 domain-containing protein [Halioglobus sp.]